MRRNEHLFIAVLLWAGLGWLDPSGAAPLEDGRKRELKELAGTWRPVSAENNGYRASDGDLAGDLWIRDVDGRWTLWRGDKAVVEWAVRKIDPEQNPKTIDIEVTAGAYAGTVYLGIYELDGETLRICFAMPDWPERPTDFTAVPGSRRALSEFEREKK